MKRTMTIAALFAVFAMTFLACQPDGLPTDHPNDNGTDVQKYKDLVQTTYTESDEAFPNPERGYYFVDDFHSPEDSPLRLNSLKVNRTLNRTVSYQGYYLTEYMESDIAPEYLELMRANMLALRESGAKAVIRFAYKTDMYETGHPWDASPEWVARHIEQVKPILQEYSDVIMVYQAGYVGVWGEWYYTDHFVSGPETPADFALRKQVTDAMLAALPNDRQIALRTPAFARMMYATDYADTLTLATAHNGSDRSRLSAFNDCFGASSNDQGTFSGAESREFWKKNSRYTFMGGETCAISKYCECGASLKDMEDYHWTYLNSEYNTKVISRWRKNGCYDEIERRLGYRLSLANVWQTPEPAAGADFRIVLEIKNSGFSAPINPRAVELILIDGKGNKTVFKQEDDPRFWFAGETVTLDNTVKLPADASGACKLYLNLPDPKETLHDNPLFSIRLANENVWDEETGYNKIAEFTL